MSLIDFDLIFTASWKFGLTTLFTFLMGIEREYHNHPASLTTHMLVGLGSCLFGLVSLKIGQDSNVDPARIAANIVSGVGFLGSATIFKTSKYTKGINTAANLWISAAIGLGVAMGYWELSFIMSILVAIILFINHYYRKELYRKRKEKLKVNRGTQVDIIVIDDNVMNNINDFDNGTSPFVGPISYDIEEEDLILDEKEKM